MVKKLLILVLLLICVNTAAAATIHGTVYNLYLDKQLDSVVTVNTVPKQTFVAKNGTYSFELPAGNYDLKAEYYKSNNLVSSTSENVAITNEGEYVVDLILFPNFSEEEGILNETDFEINGELKETIWDKLLFGGFVALLIKAIIVLISLIIIIFAARRIYKKIKKEEEKIEKEDEKDEIDEIIKFIKSKGGRATQKEIRKKFMTSQAKISLIITELEHKGIVEKIKKGRGNVIILKKK